MKRNSIYLIALAIMLLLLTGCDYEHETVECRGRNDSKYDNTTITAPDGYFMNGYAWVDVDDHTKQLIITMTKEADHEN